MNYHVNEVLLRADLAAVIARFHTKYERRGPDECWPWQSRRNGYSRYGAFRVVMTRGKVRKVQAHRLAWVLANGPVEPREMYVLHRCDNPECVNPGHLFLGTHLDNMADRDAKRRAARGEASGKSRFTNEQVAAIRRDSRPYTDIAKDYGVSPSVIGSLRTGKSWAHLPGAVPQARDRGAMHPRATLTEDMVREIRQSTLQGAALARRLGVSKAAVYEVRKGNSWRHLR